MSSLNKITNVSNKNNDGGAVIAGVSTVSGTGQVKLPSGTTGERVGIESGSLRYNSTDNTLEFYNGTSWLTISETSYTILSRGVFGGSYNYISSTNVIDYITIATTGNATDFGDLTLVRGNISACSSSTRGIFALGYVNAPSTVEQTYNVIDYITIATTGNATDFGDATVTRSSSSACSSSTRGVFGGGSGPTPTFTALNVIDYVTIATIGNATDFGDLTLARGGGVAACSSSTRGVFGGGSTPTNSNVIDYITIASTGNATDFGDLTVARSGTAACSTSTRGVFGGGITPSLVNTIDYITIATTGNATDFGDLSVTRWSLASCSSSTRGVFGGGATSPFFGGGGTSATNTIDYITIATTGNATDFGDLSVTRFSLAACSNGHGGLS